LPIAARRRAAIVAASIAARKKLIAIDKEHADMRHALNRSKAASRAQVIETLQQYQTQVMAQAGEEGQLLESEAAIVTFGRKLEQTVTQFIGDQSPLITSCHRPGKWRRVRDMSGRSARTEAKGSYVRQVLQNVTFDSVCVLTTAQPRQSFES